MCYAPPVMLRGRFSCAISERATPSPFALPSLFRLLSLTIPVHPRNAPVSPIIPIHTQKPGGGGYLFSLSDLPLSVSGACPGPVGAVNPFSVALPRSLARRSFSGGGPLTPTIPAPLATAAPRVVPPPIFTTTLRIHVGAPTIFCAKRVCRASGAGNYYAHRTQRSRTGLTCGAPPALRTQDAHERSCRSSNSTGRPVKDLSSHTPLSLAIPTLTSRSPVSLIIPAHTQNRGVGVAPAKCVLL